ncbi:hypothetical protein FE257_003115 [Aspergillus nanangensis]|uniref:Uncharacterized protein n=1 Tax=Aspergillus nanangensis TaxID=2582783 RepID=A0AAD4CD26_ASPNN|nr:hypothetical protein FE257_003115 [Aspergillus nanangensis]
MIRERVRSFSIRPDAQEDFDAHTQTQMQDFVWTGGCRSWFKPSPNGKVSALYPGSSLHYMQTLSENRWEDYIWEYNGRTRFEYWGHGLSWIEEPGADALGLQERDSLLTASSVPRADSDFSFYLWECPPLPGDEQVVTQDGEEARELGLWDWGKKLLGLGGLL